jgi:hypothetical protein
VKPWRGDGHGESWVEYGGIAYESNNTENIGFDKKNNKTKKTKPDQTKKNKLENQNQRKNKKKNRKK